MEDGSCPPLNPPPPPDPNLDDTTAATDSTQPASDQPPKSDLPLVLTSPTWDINTISSLAALRMLISSLTSLADTTGDVPPTPPASLPSTPRRLIPPTTFNPSSPRRSPAHSRTPSRTNSIVPNMISIGSPEAHPTEPLTVPAATTEPALQQLALARRFFSKTAPPFSLEAYLLRLHTFCPCSPGVYLAAGSYVARLCRGVVPEETEGESAGRVMGVVPATARTVHRLALSAIRVAAKTLEDNKWAQERVAKVGGVSLRQLLSLEVTVCFLLDFELAVGEKEMAQGMWWLQQAAGKGRLREGFRLTLPTGRRRINAEGSDQGG